MSIQEKLRIKLKPHTDNVNNNDAHDFDYFPAVLAYLIDEQIKLREATQQVSGEQRSSFNKLAVDINKVSTDARSDTEALKLSLEKNSKAARNLLMANLITILAVLVFVVFMYFNR